MLTAINLSGWFLWLLLPGTQTLEWIRVSISLLEMPVFYLYVLAICYQQFRLKLLHLAHAAPFILMNILLVMGASNANLMLIVGQIQWLVYILLVCISLRRFNRIYQQNYTEAGNQSFRWLAQLTAVFVVAHSLATVKLVITFTAYSQLYSALQILVGLSALTVTTWFVFKALSSPELFRGVSSELRLVETLVNLEQKTSDVNQQKNHQAENHSEIKQIKDYMRHAKPYLDPAITLQKLAQQMHIPSKQLSILINHKMGQHFFDFVNGYRIEAAESLLLDPDNQKMAVLEVLYQVGFNSKSSFNSAFKNKTGLTPTQFRKRQQPRAE